MCVSLYKFSLVNVLEMKDFSKSFRLSISKSLHIHPNFSQNVSPILLLNSLAMVTNKYQLLANYSNNEI